MRKFLKVVWGEACKQHRNYFHSKSIYISLFIWPFLSFVTAYYGYLPFEIEGTDIGYINAENILIYLLLGYMCMSFFRSLVQSAWNFSFERHSGTLEYIYLSPGNRFGVLLGNALSSVLESVIVMLVFGVLIMFLHREVLRMQLWTCLVVFSLVVLMAVGWGVFLNACFLYSRDTDFLFTILEEPMEIFAGVKVPVVLFPGWAKVISMIFPLTYALEAVRETVLNKASFSELKGFFGISAVILFLLFGGTLFTIQLVEKHMRKTGNVTLF